MNSGSDYINYKGTFSIVLMALCDADYNITYANIGCQGRISDGGVFSNCSLSEKLENKTLNLPLPEPLPNRNTCVPYVILGDSAFPLKENIMVPYSGNHNSQSLQRIFQYRLSRARRTIENVFGIMSSVFRVLRKPILLDANKARLVTECCVLLHNFLRRSKTSTNIYSPPGTFDREENGQQFSGSWRNDVEGMTSLIPMERRGRRSGIDAKCIRQEFGEFFMTDGRVEWQDLY